MACELADAKMKLVALDTLFKLVVYGFLRGQGPADPRLYPRKDPAVAAPAADPTQVRIFLLFAALCVFIYQYSNLFSLTILKLFCLNLHYYFAIIANIFIIYGYYYCYYCLYYYYCYYYCYFYCIHSIL